MRILLERNPAPEALSALLGRLDADPAVAGILLLACDGNDWRPETVTPILQATSTPLFGGVFPGILHGEEVLTQGVLAIGLPAPAPHLAWIDELSGMADSEERITASFPGHVEGGTLFVFVDGLAGGINELLGTLYDQFGLDVEYLGGGCGSRDLTPKPCVLSNRGLSRDCAVMALTEMSSAIGVAHGWAPVSDVIEVTGAEGNVVHSLDWRPALAVYREIVAALSGRTLSADDFYSLASAYPFGIARLGAEVVVRDPLMPLGDGIVCVGEMPQGSLVHILHATPQQVIDAAAEALARAHAGTEGSPGICLFMDCVSRYLFLKENYGCELAAVNRAGLPLAGALTIGEIANCSCQRTALEFYNKTAVVGLL